MVKALNQGCISTHIEEKFKLATKLLHWEAKIQDQILEALISSDFTPQGT